MSTNPYTNSPTYRALTGAFGKTMPANAAMRFISEHGISAVKSGSTITLDDGDMVNGDMVKVSATGSVRISELLEILGY